MDRFELAARAARHFFRLAEAAARHGGFWVSAAGGTANVVAGVIAKRCGITFPDALRILNKAGQAWAGRDWYTVLALLQPFRMENFDGRDLWEAWPPGRWDARTVARAAVRAAQAAGR